MILVAVALWVALAAAVALIYYVRFVEPARLELTGVQAPLPRLPEELEGLTIAHLSDFHYRPGREQICQDAVASANAASPDLVVITGDLADGYDVLEACLEQIADLRAPLGVWAVLGNHDEYCLKCRVSQPARPPDQEQFRATYASAGVQLLTNETERLEVKGAVVALVGVGDVSSGRDDLPAALAGAEGADLVIVLSHSPDILDDAAVEAADLVLCGHTHGGQVVLPGIGSPWAPVWRDRRRSAGLMLAGRQLCYVSRGVSSATPARFRGPPEVTVLTLRRGAPEGVRSVPVRRARGRQTAAVEEVLS